ncbi:uncharacterized protein TNCV_5064001 [Trichonephila clavipes]|nr:uncharacterized protein TNCV_5064001 [Trichonephila clavipes]
MTFCNHMCCHACNGSRVSFFNKTARPQTARVSQDCLSTVTTLPWSARSPHSSPIKHIWNHLGRQIGHPTSFNELEARLQQIWN